MYILGISAFYHDSAVCFLKNGEIVFASQEERFSRIKNDASFPLKSIIAGLEFLNIELTDIDDVVFYEKPFIKFERLIFTYIKNFPYGFNQFLKSMLIWSKEKLFQK
jgi:carbamoyltransferase